MANPDRPQRLPTPAIPSQVDLALVGGGLANLLIAHRLTDLRPELSFVVIEAASAVLGNHTWSFHETDLDSNTAQWVTPLARASWSGYDVKFPTHARSLPGRYLSIGSVELADRSRTRLRDRLITGTSVSCLEPSRVVLDDGTVIKAHCVLDGRGWDRTVRIPLGFQRFFGTEVRLERPHGLTRPIIMDATVRQDGGYRFMYALPFAPDVVLLEDTMYADTPVHDPTQARSAIAAYAASRGWTIADEIRSEAGALPIPLGGSQTELAMSWAPGVPTVGVRAGFFHPTTGYSLPCAAMVANLIAATGDLRSAPVAEVLRNLAIRTWTKQRFYRLLNRMLFLAATPSERYRVLERFYRLGEGLIARFYADRLTPFDKARILTGRPPVPVRRALACLSDRAVETPA